MEESKDKKTVPPYLSYKTFTNFIERLDKVGIPGRIDRSVMPSLSGVVQYQIIATLKYFGLIDDSGVPSDKLEPLVKALDKKILKDLIIKHYKFLFEGFDLKRASSGMVQERFGKTGATGETARKSIAFFMAAAKDTGIELSPHLKKFKFSSSKPAVPKPKKAESQEEDVIQQNPPVSLSLEEQWLNKFPNFDPSWTDEVKKSWFESFREFRKDFKGSDSE